MALPIASNAAHEPNMQDPEVQTECLQLVSGVTQSAALPAQWTVWRDEGHTRSCPGGGRASVDENRRKDATMGAEDKASNTFKDAKGKVKEAAGKATDNEQLEGEGKADQIEASIKDGVENLKDAAGNVRDAFTK
jgi:uncharacterized protein YjbJ (UPF0337 family)